MTLVGPLTLSYKLSAGSSPISRQSSLHILLSHRKGLLSFLAILPCASTDCSTPVIGTIPALLCNHDDTTVLQLHNKPPIPLACSPCFRAQPIWRATRLCSFPRKGMKTFPKCSSLNHIPIHVHKLWVAPPCPVLLFMRSWLSPSLCTHCLSTHQPLPHLIPNHHFSTPSFLF